MHKLKIGVIGTSKKIDEKRLPIHPKHLSRIPKELREQLIFEEGYGASLGISDNEISLLCAGIDTRHNLLANIGIVIINKPMLEDLKELKIGGTLWGYVHCVQQQDITQIAIKRKQTLIAFEDMFAWSTTGQIGRHTFYKNNEMAGYCAVIHALQLKGIDGHYGNQRKTIIFGFGAVSRGAIYALKAHGFRDITICIQRNNYEVREEILDCHYVRIEQGQKDQARMIVVEHDGSKRALTELISQSDIIVNGVYQNTQNPTNFVIEKESSCLKPNCLIIDVSCDEKMGFFFAKPTTFKKPIIKYKTINYYAVDHTPSYLWESATRSISEALLVYLPIVLAGKKMWHKNKTINYAINIEDGIIKKDSIISFQNRQKLYPYKIKFDFKHFTFSKEKNKIIYEN
ncbi:N(5)-(carboxyethyl)ornithine synthase [Arcobacter sp. CECT 8985]|uniref:N(5)-(carboxyethyl)ornithine synthase n=1 Tax=Arcobacter sp. CECT 8985 TaxID=1935424 RepID=UPI00100B9505|nr:N(5)-(carboxyethyl)ornithine synthase [Arcobacter sp. CECT 8985]RXJ86515.1 NAD(P) transhydrogenase subunit alpha [Arcobacter sp. CECT 8985]